MNITYFDTLKPLAERYDTLLVDLWGVIHDGQQMYPNVIEALQALKAQGTTVIFLSNAPRRAMRAVEGLQRFGIADELYHSVITSGEVAYHYITQAKHSLKPRYYIIGPERDNGLLEEAPDYIPVDHIDDADFLIVTGFDHDGSTLDEKLPEIQAGLKRQLPLVCVNPDREIVRITGVRALCAGVIADYYAQQGGTVDYFGKPHADVYQHAFALINNPDKRRIAAIGDNLHTDILGGNRAGIDSYLVPSGILSDVLDIKHGELPDKQRLESLCQQESITPTGALAAFTW